jgi:hypothetical protein
MAFHQPARQALQRTLQTANVEPRHDATQQQHSLSPAVQSQQQSPDELQTWVLFSPPENQAPSSFLSEGSVQTPGRSRVSDFGSLDTNAQSGNVVHETDLHPLAPFASNPDDALTEDDGELDSLDSHLPEFRALPAPHGDGAGPSSFAAPVFPTHDGLGSFRIDRPGNNANLQEQLYAFERFNPRRRVHDGAPELHDGHLEHEEVVQAEKMQRIQVWRLEQSRILLEEVQKETRRRRLSQASAVQLKTAVTPHAAESVSSETAGTSRNDGADAMDWHEEAPEDADASDSQSFLSRITRTVIKEFMGIDDKLLSILFGESLPDEADDLSAMSSTPGADRAIVAQADMSWQLRLLERVARELGLLVNRLSQHPGAFSTYHRLQQMTIPYAGLSVIPEAAPHPTATEVPTMIHSSDEALSPTMPEFKPTIMQQWSPVRNSTSRDAKAPTYDDCGTPSNTHGFSQEEWERELDIKLVFKYLRSRISSRFSSAPSNTTTSCHHATPSTAPDIAAKAARVRQHHPLLSGRPRTTERRGFKAMTPSSPVGLRRAPSCASQSTRRSAARRSSCSSRHYWDIGGSLGTGSVIASNGPMGSWGDL